MIDYFLDTTKDKQNKYTPGTKIKIKRYNGSIEKDVDYIVESLEDNAIKFLKN